MNCPICGVENTDNWPVTVNDGVENGGCQMCWEKQSDEEWSKRVTIIDKMLHEREYVNKLSIFLTGFLQVALVSVQTWMVANNVMFGVFGIGFLISLVWSVNVKKIAFGGWFDRTIYSLGAGSGAICGLVLAKTLVGVVR